MTRITRVFYILTATFFLLLTGHRAGAQAPPYYEPLGVFKDAVELYDKAKYGAAQEKFSLYLRLTESSSLPRGQNNLRAEALFYTGACSFYLLRNDTEPQLLSFISSYPTHTRVNEAWFLTGNIKFIRKEYPDAIEPLENADLTALSPVQKEDGHYMLGYCYFAAGRLDEALREFSTIRNGKGKYAADANYYFAAIHYQKENYGEALDGFNRIKDPMAFNGEVPVYKASCLLKLGRHDELKALKPSLDSASAASKEVFLILANAAYERSDFAESALNFGTYETKGGKLTRDADFRYGMSSFEVKDYKTARERLNKVVSVEDSLGQNAFYYLGRCFLKIENYENARTMFRKCAGFKTNPALREESQLMYAKVSFQTKYFEDALAALQQFQREFPSSAHKDEVNGLIGEILLYTNNYREAIEYFESTPKFGSDRAQAAYQRACYLYGLELFHQRNYEKANTYLKKAFNLKVDDQMTKSAYFWYAEGLFRLQNYEEAIEVYNTFLRQPHVEKHDLYHKAWYGRGWANFKQKTYIAASQDFEKFIGLADKTVEPDLYIDAILRAGDCEFMQKSFDKAIYYYQQVKDFNNQGVDYALFQMGFAYYRQKREADYIDTYQTLISRYRKSVYRDEALIRLCNLYVVRQDWANENKYASMLVSEHPESPLIATAYNKRGEAEYNLGNEARAIDFFKTVVYDYCNDKENVIRALDNLNTLLSPQDFEQVQKTLAEKCPATDLKGDARVCEMTLNAGQNLLSEDNFAAAESKFTEYLTNCAGADNADQARYKRGECFEKSGMTDKALGDYKVLYEGSSGEYGIRALERAADIHFGRKEYLISQQLFASMESRASRPEDKISAQFGRVKNQMATGNYDVALEELISIQSDPNTTEWSRNRARVQAAVCQYYLGRADDAYRQFQEIATTQTNAFGAESQYMIARILYDRKDFAASRDAALYMKDNFKTQNYWKGMASLVLAEDYLALGDTTQAVYGTLEPLIENWSKVPEVQAAARKRLEELKAAGLQYQEKGTKEDEEGGGK